MKLRSTRKGGLGSIIRLFKGVCTCFCFGYDRSNYVAYFFPLNNVRKTKIGKLICSLHDFDVSNVSNSTSVSIRTGGTSRKLKKAREKNHNSLIY